MYKRQALKQDIHEALAAISKPVETSAPIQPKKPVLNSITDDIIESPTGPLTVDVA